MLRGSCSRVLLLAPPRGSAMVPRFASTKAESPEWNRKNKVTRVLAKIDKPKDYALQWYSTLKGHYDEMTGMTKIEAAQQAVYDIENSLNQATNRKGPINLELMRLRELIHNLNHSLQLCKRHDEQYFATMQQLIEANQRDSAEQERYKAAEEEIRILFEDYKSAVMRSYAIERTQTTHFKYFSFIFSSVCGGMTFLALLLKYLTQTAEFKEMQRIMNENEKQREADELKSRLEMEGLRVLLMEQTRTLDRVLQQTTPKKQQQQQAKSGSSLYDWVAWACRPLKFW